MDEAIKSNGLMQGVRESFFGIEAKNIKQRTRVLTIMGMLTALVYLLERVLFIEVGSNSRYSFVFVAISISAILLGGYKASMVAVVADIIGSVIIYGNVNPLITLCVFISAMFYGLVLYKKVSTTRIIVAILFDQIICSLFLKSAALAIWYQGGMKAYPAVFLTRLVQVIIMIPVEIIVLSLLNKSFFGKIKKVFKDFVD